jgi:hypothetical protein
MIANACLDLSFWSQIGSDCGRENTLLRACLCVRDGWSWVASHGVTIDNVFSFSFHIL